MLVYKSQSIDLASKLPVEVQKHITGIIDASPTSNFYGHIKMEIPNAYVYLIERNQLESYTLCHVFSCDQIGQDYSYKSFSEKEIIA